MSNDNNGEIYVQAPGVGRSSPTNETAAAAVRAKAIYDAACAIAVFALNESQPRYRRQPSLTVRTIAGHGAKDYLHVPVCYPSPHRKHALADYPHYMVLSVQHVCNEIVEHLAGFVAVVQSGLAQRPAKHHKAPAAKSVAEQYDRRDDWLHVEDLLTLFVPRDRQGILAWSWRIADRLVSSEWSGIETMARRLLTRHFMTGTEFQAEWLGVRPHQSFRRPYGAFKSLRGETWDERLNFAEPVGTVPDRKGSEDKS